MTCKNFWQAGEQSLKLVLEVLKGKKHKDKLLEFDDSNQADIDKLDSKYEYHLIKVKDQSMKKVSLQTLSEMFPEFLILRVRKLKRRCFPNIPKERMFLEYSLFPGVEHEELYCDYEVPKDSDYRTR